ASIYKSQIVLFYVFVRWFFFVSKVIAHYLHICYPWSWVSILVCFVPVAFSHSPHRISYFRIACFKLSSCLIRLILRCSTSSAMPWIISPIAVKTCVNASVQISVSILPTPLPLYKSNYSEILSHETCLTYLHFC